MSKLRYTGRWVALTLLAALAVGLTAALAQQTGNPNEREVRPERNVQDPEDLFDKDGKQRPESKVWVLDFKFKDPRLASVDIPGRGRKVCWYMWYQVINRTGQPRDFVPDFELVTLDKNTVHHDQILPTVQAHIRSVEDPTDYLKIKNSVQIAGEPIPATKPDATPKAVTGVAIWDDVDIAESNRYSIFVTGLSNGWTEDDNKVVRRKTLQLNFKRVGDKFYQDSREIRFVPPYQWVYRASKITIPGAPKGPNAPPMPKAGDKDKPAAKAPAPLNQYLSNRAPPGRK